MSKPEKQLIICIPKAEHPTSPDTATCQYTEQECPVCHNGMWVGKRSMALSATGVPMMCAMCAINNGLYTGAPLKILEHHDK